jgi:phage baseplate assembly protein W
MAYNLTRRNVLDLRPSTGVGVALPFNNPRGVFKTVYTTKEQLKYNLINFLLTDKRERIFNPNFGANIRGSLFEQISEDSLDTLETTLRSGIAQYFPNVVVTNISFNAEPNRNYLTIQFSYSISNTGETDNILINFNG